MNPRKLNLLLDTTYLVVVLVATLILYSGGFAVVDQKYTSIPDTQTDAHSVAYATSPIMGHTMVGPLRPVSLYPYEGDDFSGPLTYFLSACLWLALLYLFSLWINRYMIFGVSAMNFIPTTVLVLAMCGAPFPFVAPGLFLAALAWLDEHFPPFGGLKFGMFIKLNSLFPSLFPCQWVLQSGAVYLTRIGFSNTPAVDFLEDYIFLVVGIIATCSTTGSARHVSSVVHIMQFAKKWILGPETQELTDYFMSLAAGLDEAARVTKSRRIEDYTLQTGDGDDGEGDAPPGLDKDDPDWLQRAINYLAKSDALLRGKFGQSVLKVAVTLVGAALFVHERGNFSFTKFMAMQEGHYYKTVTGSVSFFSEILRAIKFLTTNGYNFMTTGKWDDLVYDSNCAVSWNADLAKFKLAVKNYTVAGPDSGAKTVEELMSLSDDLARRIDTMISASNLKLGRKDPVLSAMRSEYLAVKSDFDVKRVSRATRQAPFSVLVQGSPAVGKSIFTEIFKTLAAKVFGFDLGDSGVVHVHSGTSDFMDGLTSKVKMVIIDDIGQFNPKAVTGIDAQLRWLIGMVNNVAFVPNMADLADKGKIDFRPECILATTNTVHLNARHYFCHEFALRRRLRHVVQLCVKRECATEETRDHPPDKRVLDQRKVIFVEGGFPDLWDIDISEVVCRANGDTELMSRLKTSSIDQAVMFLGARARESKDHEAQVASNIVKLNSTKLCDTCFKPMGSARPCDCPQPVEMQAGVCSSLEEIGPVSGYFPSPYYICAMFVCLSAIVYVGIRRHSLRVVRFALDRICSRLTLPLLTMFLHFGVIDREAYLRILGRRLVAHRPKFVAALGAAIAVGGVLWYCLSMLRGLVHQGGSAPDQTAPVDKAPNVYKVWRKPHPLGSMSKTNAGACGNEAFMNKYATQVYRLVIRGGGVEIPSVVFAFKVSESVIVTVSHAFADREGHVTISWATSGARGTVQSFQTALVHHLPGTDLCSFILPDTPLGKSISLDPDKSPFMMSLDMVNCDGHYMSLQKDDGTQAGWVTNIRKVDWISHLPKQHVPMGVRHMGVPCDEGLLKCTVPGGTAMGDCGSVCVLSLGAKAFPVLAGLHSVGTKGGGTTGFCVPLTIPIVTELIRGSVAMINDTYVRQSGPAYVEMLGRAEPTLVKATLEDTVHPKCPTQWLGDQPNLPPMTLAGHILGADGGKFFRPKRTSAVVDAPTRAFMEARGYVCGKTAPVLTGYAPPRNNLIGMSSDGHLKQDVLMAATSGYYRRIVKGISALGPDKVKLGTISDHHNVNGDPNNRFMQPLNFSTSSGWPYCRPKGEKFPVVGFTESGQAVREPDADIVGDMSAITASYMRGEAHGPPFMATLKDEPVSLAKAASHTTRVIYGVTVAFGLLIRRYFLLFIVLFQSNSYIFEGAPGINACSREWTTLYAYITKYGTDRIIAGDYKGWDKSVLSASIMRAAFEVILGICLQFGRYSEYDTLVMRGIATDVCYATCCYFGTLVQFFGTNMSGHNLTVIVNCIVNSILMRYAYIELALRNGDPRPLDVIVSDFDENVNLMTYGDDNQMGVSPDIPWFNHSALSQFFDSIGITYTDAAKTGRVFDYEGAEDTTFLKRGYRHEPTETDGCIRAPLDRDSIIRSLMVWVASSVESPKFQLVSVIRSAHREAYQHGRETFKEFDELIGEMVVEFDLGVAFESSPLPTWDQYTADMYGPG